MGNRIGQGNTNWQQPQATGQRQATATPTGGTAPTQVPIPRPRPSNLNTQNQNQVRSGVQSANFDPVAQGVFSGSGTPSLEDMTAAIQRLPGNESTPAQAREIAQAVLEASRTYEVDPRIMLSIIGRESKFNPTADDGNGHGLGQLTSSATDELARIGRGGSNGTRAGLRPDTYAMLRTPESRELFARVGTRSGRMNIRDNVMASAAYARVMMDTNSRRGADVNVSGMLSNYNGAGGTIQRQYPGKVGQAYTQLWGGEMPARIANGN